MHASSPACNEFLRFTSGVTPAAFLVVYMATESFDPHTCTYRSQLVLCSFDSDLF